MAGRIGLLRSRVNLTTLATNYRGIASTSRAHDNSKDAVDSTSTLHLKSVTAEEKEHLIKSPNITVRINENVGLVSGVPENHIATRTVRIYQPPKNAMQSGTNNIHYWQIDFDTRPRWENPLIGWASTGDPMSNLKVDFASMEDAIEHCEKMGWKYYVQKPNRNQPMPRSYGINFSWNKRTRVSTK